MSFISRAPINTGNSLFLLLCLSIDFTSNKSSVPSRVFYASLNDHCIPDCIFANELDSDALNTAVASKRKRIRFAFEKITSEQRFFIFSLRLPLNYYCKPDFIRVFQIFNFISCFSFSYNFHFYRFFDFLFMSKMS